MFNKMLPANNESGFVLVAVMLMLLILAFIGITSTTTSNIELQIAGNDKTYKQTFYAADSGAAIIGSHLLEENLNCWKFNGGFANNVAADTADTPSVRAGSSIINGQIVVERTSAADLTPRRFWENTATPTTISDTNRDLYYPINYGNGPHTNIRVGGAWTQLNPGTAIQMNAGYDIAVQTAASINFTILSQSTGALNSTSEVEILWPHGLGLEDPLDCNY